jgi:imidazolonepropionase-like amidohydrolase
MTIALLGATVIDGTGASPKKDCTVVIEDSKIVELTDRRDFGEGCFVYDAAGKTIIPGLIDCHQHLTNFNTLLVSFQAEPLMYYQAKGIAGMRACLEVGCTTTRDLGGLESGFVKAQREGLIIGPRLQTCVMQIQPTNGMLDYMPGVGGAVSPQGHAFFIPGLPSGWADGVEECRKKVREMLRYGAEIIKILNSPHPAARPWLDPWRLVYSDEEILAIVDEAHMAGVEVTAHTIGQEGTKQAVRCGVDCIEHGAMMDEETMELMAEKGTWWVPTYLIFRFHATVNPDLAWRKMAGPIYEYHQKILPQALAKGVRIAMGTDAAYAMGDIPAELTIMVESGMSPLQAIEVSTLRAAECLGMADEIGTIQTGKEADLLIVDGDPLADISILDQRDKLLAVMQAGKVLAGVEAGQFPWTDPGWPKPMF